VALFPDPGTPDTYKQFPMFVFKQF